MRESIAYIADRSSFMVAPLTADLPSDVARAIRCDEICDQFETAWRNAGQHGDPPSLEACLALGSEAEREFLVEELIRLDFHYRRSRGEFPVAADYAARYSPVSAALFDDVTSDVAAGTPQRAWSSMAGRTFG